jgi:hypothetical protein
VNSTHLGRAAAAILTLAIAAPLPAQGRVRLSVASDFVKEPSGTVLGRLAAGTVLGGGPVKGTWQEVTIDGWAAATALRDDKRDGFDVSVNLADGTTIRAAAAGGATLATARAGALFNRVESKSGWVHVRRTAWVARSALGSATAPVTPPPAPAAKPVTPPASQAAVPPPPPPSQAPVGTTATTMLTGGTTLAAVPSGSAMGTFEIPVKAEVIERRNGWAHVRVDGWVRDGSLGEAPPPGSITAADLRSQPERYVGQTVEWTLQVIAVQKADELRPELPNGQPYVLARGPLPESGFVYMVIPLDQESTFRGLQPLTKLRVRATVRAGRSKYLPVPVLTFVRKLD